MKKTEIVQVRMDTDLRQKLQTLADADHRALGEYIRVHLIKLVEAAKAADPGKQG